MKILLGALLFLYLLVVGIWPSAAAPVGAVLAGAGVIVAQIPVVVLVLAGAAYYLHHRPVKAAA